MDNVSLLKKEKCNEIFPQQRYKPDFLRLYIISTHTYILFFVKYKNTYRLTNTNKILLLKKEHLK